MVTIDLKKSVLLMLWYVFFLNDFSKNILFWVNFLGYFLIVLIFVSQLINALKFNELSALKN